MCRGETLQLMVKFQRELLNSAVEEKDGLPTVKVGAWFCEAMTVAEIHFCWTLLDRLT